MKTQVSSDQMSLFDLPDPSPAPVLAPVQALETVTAPVLAPSDEIDNILLPHWTDSKDLAFCLVNALFPVDEELLQFAIHWTVPQPSKCKTYDQLGRCLARLEFTIFDDLDGPAKLTTLSLAVEAGFHKDRRDVMRASAVDGDPPEQLEKLEESIGSIIEPVMETETNEKVANWVKQLREIFRPKVVETQGLAPMQDRGDLFPPEDETELPALSSETTSDITPEFLFQNVLRANWSNSMDLAYSMVNVVLPDDQPLRDFVEYNKQCRLADTGNCDKPSAVEQYDRLAWCLRQMEFSEIERAIGKGEVLRTETNLLDWVIDVSFDEEELGRLREFSVRGVSGQQIGDLGQAVKRYVDKVEDEFVIPTSTPNFGEVVQRVENLVCDMQQKAYQKVLERLGVSSSELTKDAFLKAVLAAIGTDEKRLDIALTYGDITVKNLYKAAADDLDARRRLNEITRKQLTHDLAYFTGTEQWHRHRCLCPIPVFLTDGTKHVAEHGGINDDTAYWLFDDIASYQGEKKVKSQQFQKWKLIVQENPESGKRTAVLTCGENDKKPIVRQEYDYTNFLLNEITLWASLDPIDEKGTIALIIILPSEY